MTTETDELLTDLRAIASELSPHRDPTRFNPPDYLLVLGVLIRRQLQNKIDKLPPAHVGEPRYSAKTKKRKK